MTIFHNDFLIIFIRYEQNVPYSFYYHVLLLLLFLQNIEHYFLSFDKSTIIYCFENSCIVIYNLKSDLTLTDLTFEVVKKKTLLKCLTVFRFIRLNGCLNLSNRLLYYLRTRSLINHCLNPVLGVTIIIFEMWYQNYSFYSFIYIE